MAWRAQLDPAIWPGYLSSGARIVARRVRGHRRHPGDAPAICRAVVESCWTGRYLAASGGHFRQFWTRDLGFSAEALVTLGQGDRVRASLAWALEAWAPAGRVTTTIFPGRRPRDVWTFGVDSLPLLLHTLQAVEAHDLVERHGGWLGREVRRYGELVLDARTGLVRDDRAFSSHRDTVRIRSNAYANVMLALLDRVLRETDWHASPVPAGIEERFVETFWRDDRFVDRPDTREVTGDATTAPFIFGIAPDALGLAAALRAAAEAGLADPLPLRYAARRDPGHEDPLQRRLVPDYQGTAVWTSLGAWYLALLLRADPAAAAPVAAAFRQRIERDGTVFEVFDGRGRTVTDLRPYRGAAGLFTADEAMLWAAILVVALEAAEPEAAGAR
jgi:hypothetical protein